MPRSARAHRDTPPADDAAELRGRTATADGHPAGRRRSRRTTASPCGPRADKASPPRSSSVVPIASTSAAATTQERAPGEAHDQARASPGPQEGASGADVTPVTSPGPEASSAAVPDE